MIRLHEAELISVLPPFVKSNTDVQAISYAFKMGAAKLFSDTARISLYANIDYLPENLLDLLALELQSQYYDEMLDIETKRELIKNTLTWYMRGGSVAAVREMVRTIFGSGITVEWDESGDAPGTFYITTTIELTPEKIRELKEVIEKVKNKRSHLTSVKAYDSIQSPVYIAVHNRSMKNIINDARHNQNHMQ